MLRYPLLVSIGMVLLLPGCSQPAVALKPLAVQERENTVRDWNTVADAITTRLVEHGLLVPNHTAAPPRRYFVHLLRPESAFLQQVREALNNALLARGQTVAREPADSLVINLDAAAITWSRDRKSVGAASTVAGTAAGGAEVLAANGPYTPAAIFGMAAGAGLVLDVADSLRPDTRTEAIWKALVVTDDAVLMDATAPVYVRHGDLGLYESEAHSRPMTSLQPRVGQHLVQLRLAQGSSNSLPFWQFFPRPAALRRSIRT